MELPVAIIILLVTLVILALAIYLIATINELRAINNGLADVIDGVTEIVTKTAPVNGVLDAINGTLVAGRNLLEGLALKKTGADAAGLVESCFPGEGAKFQARVGVAVRSCRSARSIHAAQRRSTPCSGPPRRRQRRPSRSAACLQWARAPGSRARERCSGRNSSASPGVTVCGPQPACEAVSGRVLRALGHPCSVERARNGARARPPRARASQLPIVRSSSRTERCPGRVHRALGHPCSVERAIPDGIMRGATSESWIG